MIERTLFTPDHEAFRDSFRRFMDKEIAPFHADWEEQGYVDREVWNKAGRKRLSVHDHARGIRRLGRRQAVLGDPDGRARPRAASPALATALHSEIVAPYILHYGTARAEGQVPAPAGQRRDDWRHCHERARRGLGPAGRSRPPPSQQADGSYLLNGSKTFITNGWHADLVIVVAKTNPAAGGKGTSLMLVERGMPGFCSGQAPEKAGPEGAGHLRAVF